MKQPIDRLIQQIRETSQYVTWRSNVLKQAYGDRKPPRNIQVHHRTRIKDILNQHNITSLSEALNCTELWEVSNGVAITKGEHYIITQLERYKHTTPAFSQLLKEQAERLTK